MPATHPKDAASFHFLSIVASACALAAKAHEVVGPDHLLLSVSYQNGPLWRVTVSELRIDPIAVRLHVESSVDAHNQPDEVLTCGVLSSEANAIIGDAHALGEERGCTSPLNVGTLLLALLGNTEIAATLDACGVDAATLKVHVERNLERLTDEL